MSRINRQDRILESAAAVFSRDGYEGSSIRDIAAMAGVKTAAIYYHFESKEDLYAAIMESHLVDALEKLERCVTAPVSPSRKLRDAILANISGTASRPLEATVFLRNQRALPTDRYPRHAAMRRRYEELWKSILEEGVRASEFPPHDVSTTVLAILGMCNWVPQWYRPGGRLTAEEIADRFSMLILDGLRAPNSG